MSSKLQLIGDFPINFNSKYYFILKKNFPVIIKQYRQVKPDSDKSTKELTIEFEKKLAKAPFIARLGNDIYYLYYFKNEKINTYL
ncbi:unnamed protein product [Rotaria sp. Silwood2]|nr:unnamed protein product [Rotaria sp. Silwood2]